MLEKFQVANISATCRPIHFVFCSRVGFSGMVDLMVLLSIRTNSRFQQPPSQIISNGHISATAHDLLIYRASRGHLCDSTAFLSFLLLFLVMLMFSFVNITQVIG